MARHQCPVCGVMHEVSAIRAQFAYGRQLACSCDCEAERRRRRRRLTRQRHVPGPAGGKDPGVARVSRVPAELTT